MDADWDEIARVPFPPPNLHAMPTPVSTMTFDNLQELLWTGNEYGRVTSFYGAELQRYTSFKAHAATEGPVRQILVNDKGVIALGAKDLHMAMRRGLPQWHIRHPDMKDLKCMSFTSKGTAEVLLAGLQEVMLVVDLNKGEVTKQIPTEHRYTIMRRGRYICAATKTGSVHLLDPISFAVVRTWNAHSALISDMDAQHDFIVTCGYSLRQGQNYVLDPFLNVFDIKQMSSMPPIPFPAGAAYIHIVDLMNPNSSNVRQANVLTYLAMFDVAPSGEAIALTDADCQIHLWGSPSKMHFVDLPAPVEFATPEEPSPQIEWTADTPSNLIGLPYYRELLASAWPENVSDVGAPPVKYDPQFLASLKPSDFGLYGRNTRGLRRNQVELTRDSEKQAKTGLKAPKFLSEKARESVQSIGGGDDKADDLASPLGDTTIDSKKAEVPVMYRSVEIKYSKFGVDDFDFGFYNKTRHSGLETHISNSYANALLQILHFTPLATNLLKTLSNYPQAGALGLLEEDPHNTSVNIMLQGLTRFLLDRFAQDYKPLSPNPAAMEQVLKHSIERETTSKGWCSRCQRYQTISTRKTVHNIPAVLMLNTTITSQEHKMLWATPGWLPEEIGIIVEQGQFFCYEGEDLKLHLQRGIHNITVYSLVGAAVNIENGQAQKPHLVSIINVAHAEPTDPGKSKWHLFNDFLVRSVTAEEALTFNTAWKLPSVLAFQVKEANNQMDTSWKITLDTSLLYQDFKYEQYLARVNRSLTVASPNADPATKTYQVLNPNTEAPGPGMIIALDTEFVAVRQPEIEMNSDGERETIRPIVYALARVSVVRGQGQDEGKPFIDDYIAIREPIVDYLTSYSGITQQDLDPRVANHCILSLKKAYKKLWILLNLGCKFLGHGLKQDFRVINIHVPKVQVIDTIDLFFLKARLRRLSLAFLAWYLLKEDIQLETHDSIEDSRTALKLYRKFLEFEDAGILDQMLLDIYRVGRDVNFKPPRKEGQGIQRTDTPPLPAEGSTGPPTTPKRDSGSLTASVPGSAFGGTLSWTPGKGSPMR
ncbi:ubiquitin carboxyl-terminal hydrolase family protein [Emericellopsis cladophorae]|uniref:PAN2-PAN3 deadenylation complex catalytic subunit PAN2 n=1 Tax=Emericellopsis cladophorae TaxID=2686198 RepID=A0A9P9Y5A1_9HYPO|nr:ubiquitin carboxyl-terminal hydrolase family protein [Emericellopsis cladophorae]KAI6783498.1 ubiquitin carboxyl-terminal hydrolase family protein [Emericellopsis cladophorae]